MNELNSEISSVEALRAALVESLARESGLRSQLQAVSVDAHVPPRPQKCYFLEMIPTEIRSQIYGYLLVNDVLSTTYSIAYGVPACSRTPPIETKYDLSPALLRTCRRIYDEAELVLYGKNTFLVYCLTQEEIQCPLNRNVPFHNTHANRDPIPFEYSSRSSKVLKAKFFPPIKHWKVLIGTARSTYNDCPSFSFFNFCENLCHKAPQTLKVVIVPYGEKPHPCKGIHFDDEHYDSGLCHKLRNSLLPATFLRGISKFKLLQGTEEDMKAFDKSKGPHPNPPHPDFNLVKAELETLVTGNSPVMHLSQNYECLHDYAQAFERNATYRAEMDCIWGQEKWEILRYRLLIYYVNLNEAQFDIHNPDEVDDLTEADYTRWNFTLPPRRRYESPFKALPYHPVEKGLVHAAYGHETNNPRIFKTARAQILNYLEPQYQRIVAAFLAVVSFEASSEGIFEPDSEIDRYNTRSLEPMRRQFSEFRVLLDNYAQSFVRDAPHETQINIRAIQPSFDLAYSGMRREFLFKKIDGSMKFTSHTSAKELARLFREVVWEMDEQFREIQETREVLFAGDSSDDRGCNIELSTRQCNEAMDYKFGGSRSRGRTPSNDFNDDRYDNFSFDGPVSPTWDDGDFSQFAKPDINGRDQAALEAIFKAERFDWEI